MANLEKRGSHTPRRVRERRAYQLLVAGGVSGTAGVVALVLAIAGTMSAFWAILLLAVAASCVALFRRQVGR